MATGGPTIREKFQAAADLSAKRHHLVTISTTGTINLPADGTVQAFPLEDDPASGEFGSVTLLGVSKVAVGASINAGVAYMGASDGEAVAATATNVISGITLEAGGAAGVVVKCLVCPMGIV
jgi:hypothetical protein